MKHVPENISFLKFLEQDYSLENIDASILNNIDAFVFFFDAEKMIPVWLNDFFYNRLKYAEEDLQNLTREEFEKMFHPKSLKHLYQRLNNYDKSKDKSVQSLYQVKTKDNKWLYMLTCTRVFKRSHNGSIKLLLGFATEVDKSELSKHLNRINELDDKCKDFALIGKLSKRETEVLKLIANGLTDKEISKKFQISINTSKTHRKRIISKLGLKNTAALVKFAVENGMD